MKIMKIMKMINNVLLRLIVVLIAYTPAIAIGTHLMPEDISYALVIDTKDDDGVPKKFRTTKAHSKEKPVYNAKFDATEINFVSLKDLKIAASAQFSEESLKNILRDDLHGKVIVIDLRKEPHGFVNGVPVSWYLPGNIINWQRSPADAANIEKELLNSIAKKATVTLHKLKKDKRSIEVPSVKYIPLSPTKIKLVESEQELVKRYNLQYVRLFVRDRNKPDPSEVDAFIAFIKTVPPDTWIYLHCRGGSGRSTTFMAMYDMIKNADKVSFDNILKRQAYIGGKFLYDLPKDKKDYKYKSLKERLDFLHDFYDYVVDPRGFKTSKWSNWTKSTQ